MDGDSLRVPKVTALTVTLAWLLFILRHVNAQVFIHKSRLRGHDRGIDDTFVSWPSSVSCVARIERDYELGWRVRIFARNTESHEVGWHHLNAVVLALSDHCVAVIRRNKPVKELVHDLDLNVRFA